MLFSLAVHVGHASPAKRRLILSLLSKLSQAGGKTQPEEQLINGTQVRDAPLLAIYVASGANLPQRSLLLSLSLHSTPNSQGQASSLEEVVWCPS